MPVGGGGPLVSAFMPLSRDVQYQVRYRVRMMPGLKMMPGLNKGLFARACSTAPSANGVVRGAALAASAGLRCEQVTMRSIGWRGK